MTFRQFLETERACSAARDYCRARDFDFRRCYQEVDRGDWLTWIANRFGERAVSLNIMTRRDGTALQNAGNYAGRAATLAITNGAYGYPSDVISRGYEQEQRIVVMAVRRILDEEFSFPEEFEKFLNKFKVAGNYKYEKKAEPKKRVAKNTARKKR